MKSNMTTWQTGLARVGVLGIFARNYCSRGVVVLALAFVGVTASLGVAKTVHADTLYATGFERPTFQDGDQLVGIDGWTGAVPPPPFSLNPDAAIITRHAARRGHQSVEVRGVDLIASGGNTPPYDAVGSYRRPVNHTMIPGKRLARVDADLLLETNQPKTPGEFFSLTIAARSGDGETLGEVGLSSEGVVEAFPFDSAAGAIPAFTKPIRFNKWYHITMLLDFANRTTSYFIDDHFIGAVQAPSTSDVLLRGAMVAYARPDGDASGGAGSTRSSYTARFDNFRVSVHSAAPDIDD